MQEGSLGAPIRHPIPWQDDDWYDEQALDAELRRVFDICHGCRRCFNLCNSFPTLFDLIDESPNEEVEDLTASDLKAVVDECTLCDMCFMVKCPYVPPHEFDLDFPHLMLRFRAVEHKNGKTSFSDKQLAETDRMGKLGTTFTGIANAAVKQGSPARGVMKSTLGISEKAHLPTFEKTPFAKVQPPAPNPEGPAFGRKVAIYATCYGNFNDSGPGDALMKVLAHQGVDVRIEYPGCCGMPKLENGNLEAVADSAVEVATHFAPLIADGYEVVPLTTSCALMLKFEWPLIHPDNELVETLSKNTYDVSQYVVALAEETGLAPIDEMDARVSVHFACHSRAQNMGAKAMEMLKLIPGTTPQIVERCSGHGGKWGIYEEHFDTAVKVGRPAARKMTQNDPDYMVSECPLAGPHLKQLVAMSDADKAPARVGHPIEILAKAYGL